MLAEIRNCDVGYGKPIIRGIEFHLDFGEILNVYGENGVGKTTLLKAFLGISILRGEIRVLSKNILDLAPIERFRYISVAFAETIRTDITIGRYFELSPFPILRELIEAFGLSEILNRTFRDISTGNNRKVQIVRALSSPAPVIALDEPFAHLDDNASKVLWEIIEDLRRRGKSFIITSHRFLGVGRPFKLPPTSQ
jgi:ABC-type cobalamin/Fe3+-siderophores transport systems, ATPase components